MMPTRLSLFTRGTTWLLALAFCCASLPMPVVAQMVPPLPDESAAVAPEEAVDEEAAAPAEEVLSPAITAQERIRQLRAGSANAEAPAGNVIRARASAAVRACPWRRAKNHRAPSPATSGAHAFGYANGERKPAC